MREYRARLCGRDTVGRARRQQTFMFQWLRIWNQENIPSPWRWLWVTGTAGLNKRKVNWHESLDRKEAGCLNSRTA